VYLKKLWNPNINSEETPKCNSLDACTQLFQMKNPYLAAIQKPRH
jgi:hypothetical protein